MALLCIISFITKPKSQDGNLTFIALVFSLIGDAINANMVDLSFLLDANTVKK